jgi:hypothetical protein
MINASGGVESRHAALGDEPFRDRNLGEFQTVSGTAEQRAAQGHAALLSQPG